MTIAAPALPEHYAATIRTTIRYVVVLAVVALLVGIAFQESAKKLDFEHVGAGLHIEARVHLALVHGHVFVLSVLLPLALIAALYFALCAGGRPLGPRGIRWLTLGLLPSAAATVALMFYKGYHFLLLVRGGVTELAQVDAAFFGGLRVLRYGVYGVIHGIFGLSLVALLVLLWRSLKKQEQAE